MAQAEARGRAGRASWMTMLVLAQAAVLFPAALEQAGAAFPDQFVWPMDGRVTSIYWECRSDCARWHRGVDIANGCDTAIHAARSGTVSTVAYDEGGYGNYVVVDHDFGYLTLYAHMKSVSVAQGDSVTTSTLLGREGRTGSATGCHVHFEVRQDDNGPSVELKQFLPGAIDDRVARGSAVPYAAKLLEAKVATDVLNGPNLADVAGQGDDRIGTMAKGARYVGYGSWTNDAGETWHAVNVDGRVGWVLDGDVLAVAGTARRVTADGVLNVRAGAGSGNQDIGDVHGGQAYEPLGSAQDGNGATWYKIRYHGSDGGSVGWIHGGYTTEVTYQGGRQDLSGLTITVDPGHGGSDPGASALGLQEKAVVLDIALRLRDLLEADGARVLMTRTTDATVSLQARVDLANNHGADRYVSIHANACDGCGGHGTETYYHSSLPSTSTSAKLAGKVQAEVVDHLGTRDRGVKTADFFVLRETTMPAVLVETAFVDHAGDNAILDDPAQRQEAARGILHALQDHFGAPIHDPAAAADTAPPSITLTAPDLAAWHAGDVTVEADISDPSGLAWARARLAGGDWLWDSTAPHRWTFATAGLADGSHEVEVQAKDNAGNTGSQKGTLRVDNTPPTVRVTEPDDGDIVLFGVTVEASASDAGSGVARVKFYVDGALRHTDTAAPWAWDWDAFWEPGEHTVTARAEDHAGWAAEHSVEVLVL